MTAELINKTKELIAALRQQGYKDEDASYELIQQTLVCLEIDEKRKSKGKKVLSLDQVDEGRI